MFQFTGQAIDFSLRPLLLASSLLLVACNGNPATTTAAPASDTAASAASEPALPAASELSGGKVRIQTIGGFSDAKADSSRHPEGVSAEQLLLLQHNDAYNTTVYAAHFGKTEQKADAYFAKLKAKLEKDKNLQHTQIEQEGEQRLNYRFSQSDANGDIALNESCSVFVQQSEIYSVCAYSDEVSPEDLADIIKDSSIQS